MADIDHNLTKLKELIRESLKRSNSLEGDREQVNAELMEIRTALAAKGIPKKAYDMARRYIAMDPDDREGFDIAYALVREVGGLPMQEDLFTAADRLGNRELTDEEDNGGDGGEADEDGDGEEPEPDAAGIAEHLAQEDAAKKKNKAKSGGDNFFDPAAVAGKTTIQ